MKVSNETKIGALAAIAITVFILGYGFLSGIDLFNKRNSYIAVYNRINGLNVSDPVFINGYPVGKVASLKLLDDRTGRIIAKFEIDDDFRIPSNTVAEIVSADLLGQKAVEFKLGDAITYLEPGDTIMAAVQLGLTQQLIQELYPIRDKIGTLFASIDSVMSVIQFILNEETKRNIDKSLVNVQNALAAFAGSAATLDTLMRNEANEIDHIMNNVVAITDNIRNNNAEIASIIKNAAAFTDSLAKADVGGTIIEANKAIQELNSALAKINRGEGSLGMLMQDEAVYNNLRKASNNLDRLLFDLKANPERYLHFSVITLGRKKTVPYEDEDAGTKDKKATPTGKENKPGGSN